VLQVISTPQHDGDLIIPQSLGHFDTATVVPSSVVMWSCTSACPHLTHVNPVTPIPHCPHTYSMMFLLSSGRCSSINTSQIVRKTTAIAPANKPQQLYDIGRVGLIPDRSDYKWSCSDRLKTGHRHSWLSLASELGGVEQRACLFLSSRAQLAVPVGIKLTQRQANTGCS